MEGTASIPAQPGILAVWGFGNSYRTVMSRREVSIISPDNSLYTYIYILYIINYNIFRLCHIFGWFHPQILLPQAPSKSSHSGHLSWPARSHLEVVRMNQVPSGYVKHSYWTWPFIDIYSGFSHEKWWIFPYLCKRLPEGKWDETHVEIPWNTTSMIQCTFLWAKMEGLGSNNECNMVRMQSWILSREACLTKSWK